MAHIDPGVTGAKRATWREFDPRPILLAIIAANPKAAENFWREQFWEKIVEGVDDPGPNSYLYAMAQYYLDNHIRAIIDEQTGSSARRRKQNEAAVRERTEKLTALILLNLQMPNGKILGECTGAECKKFGGWYIEIAKVVPARKVVADVLSENEIRKLWNKHRV